MACACKNKVKKVEDLFEKKNIQYEKKGVSKLSYVFGQALGRIFVVLLLMIFFPIAVAFLMLRILISPEKQILINMNKIIEQWKKHTE